MGSGRGVHEAAFGASAVPALVLDLSGVVLEANGAYAAMSGRPLASLPGARSNGFIHADDLPLVVAGIDALLAGAPRVVNRRRHRRGDGTWLEVTVATSLLPGDDGEETQLLVEVLDQGPIEVDVDAEGTARFLLQASGDVGCFHDAEGRVELATANLVDLLGLRLADLRGRRLTDEALAPVLPGGEAAGPESDPVLQALATGAEASGTLGLQAAGGHVVWVSVLAAPASGSALAARSSLRDISELVRAQEEARRLAALVEAQLIHAADHDDLTGLKSRRVAVDHVEAALAAGAPLSVVFVDLDDFKRSNDRLGHLGGDDLLVAAAARLRHLAGPAAVVARAGGDEFLVLTGTRAAAERLAAEVLEASAGPRGLVARHGEVLRASAGVAHAEAGDTRTSLFTRADAAMYAVKRDRRRSGGAG